MKRSRLKLKQLLPRPRLRRWKKYNALLIVMYNKVNFISMSLLNNLKVLKFNDRISVLIVKFFPRILNGYS